MFKDFNFCAASLAIACVLQGCSLQEPEAVTEYGRINVSLFDNYAVELCNHQTKTATDASGAGVRFISFAAVSTSDGSIAYSCTQKVADEGFGSVEMVLPVGAYTLVAEGHSGSDSYGNATITSGSRIDLPSGGVKETFCATTAATVSADEELDVEMTLNRVTSRLRVTSTVAQPSSVKQVLVCVGEKSKAVYTAYFFAPADGLMTGFGTDGHMLYNKSAGSSSGTLTSFTFDLLLASADQTLPVVIEVTDGFDNVLYSHTLASVSFSQNCTTVIEGPLFAVPGEASLQFETAWGEDINAGW